jgi:hypothetical protein
MALTCNVPGLHILATAVLGQGPRVSLLQSPCYELHTDYSTTVLQSTHSAPRRHTGLHIEAQPSSSWREKYIMKVLG